MFTGLVEHMGTVAQLTTPTSDGGYALTIEEATPILEDCHVGDSICVNGTCLSVTTFTHSTFQVGLAPETISRTNLKHLKPNDKVNLERAMKVGSRYGGHVVQGHVDTTATITSKVVDGDSVRFSFRLSQSSPFLVSKGYITLDGTSLTLTHVSPNGLDFGIMLIAHSQEKVILNRKVVGDTVNVEFDVVAKGMERIVEHVLGLTSEGQGSQSVLETMIERAVDRALDRRGIKNL